MNLPIEDSVNNWEEKNILKVRDDRSPEIIEEDNIEIDLLRNKIEPWLTALFQSEHLSLLTGTGISSAAHVLAVNQSCNSMKKIDMPVFEKQITKMTEESAKKLGRGKGNIEDQIRVVNELIKGLEIYACIDAPGIEIVKKKIVQLKQTMNDGIFTFINSILKCEKNIISANTESASEYLMSFLVSFASRASTRERLNIFTTNYDRVIEFGAELAGIRLIDRFVGSINPIFRASRLEVDMHYNPPGIRGEPRYLEGVVHFTKLHGSIDWVCQNGLVKRIALPYGANDIKTYSFVDASNMMIYPNSAKDRETSEYPYVELFRDLASAICRPNATLVLYGYGFGDEHINRVIADMLTIPSTHLVIISYNDEGGRIHKFYKKLKRPSQISLLVGKHFGDLKTLVDNYLPKSAIDKTTFRMSEILKSRGYVNQKEKSKNETNANIDGEEK